MRTRDVLVHYPYQSFATSVERFVKQAVDDPNVLAIKMTVYRTSDDSALVPSLIEAAEKGKQAVCLVELKARFDERQNIGWSRALEEVGAHVVHGIPGLKTHAKAILVVRRERGGVRHYVMIGTGNFHAKNARLYEDFGLFTTDREIGQEVANLFNTLTGYGHPERERKVLVAPNSMRGPLIEEIDRTDRRARGRRAGADRDEDELAGRPAVHRGAVPRLAGRRPDRPQRPRDLLPAPGRRRASARRSRSSRWSGGSSSTRGSTRSIAARSSVYYIGSADLMPRNLDTRVELLAPVEDPELQAELEDTLERCLADDTFAWTLDAEGAWTRRTGRTRSVHRELMERTLQQQASTAAYCNRPWPRAEPATVVRSEVLAVVALAVPTGSAPP